MLIKGAGIQLTRGKGIIIVLQEVEPSRFIVIIAHLPRHVILGHFLDHAKVRRTLNRRPWWWDRTGLVYLSLGVYKVSCAIVIIVSRTIFKFVNRYFKEMIFGLSMCERIVEERMFANEVRVVHALLDGRVFKLGFNVHCDMRFDRIGGIFDATLWSLDGVGALI